MLAGTAPIVRDFSVVNALLLDALARDMLGDAKAAEDDVERALDLAEPDALVLPFLIVPARDLLERHPRHRTAHAGASREHPGRPGGVVRCRPEAAESRS